jgi:hypothetical protein
VSVPGAELLGLLPAELQAMNVISAGIVTDRKRAGHRHGVVEIPDLACRRSGRPAWKREAREC